MPVASSNWLMSGRRHTEGDDDDDEDDEDEEEAEGGVDEGEAKGDDGDDSDEGDAVPSPLRRLALRPRSVVVSAAVLGGQQQAARTTPVKTRCSFKLLVMNSTSDGSPFFVFF